MKESNKLLIDLLDYIEQVEKLNRKPNYVVPSDIFDAHQSELKGLPGIHFNVQSEGDDVWLRITRLKEISVPEPVEALKAWVTVSKSPNHVPELKEEIVIAQGEDEEVREYLLDHPEIQALFDHYVKNIWEPWSLSEKPRRKTIGFYNKLFSVQQAIYSDSANSPIELAWGIGYALWNKPGMKTPIQYPLIIQQCEIYLNPTNFDLEIRPRDLDPQLDLGCYQEQENEGVRALDDFWKSVSATSADRINPFESSTFEGILKAAVLHLDASGVYLDNLIDQTLPAPDENLIVTDTWVLFGRKRSEHIFIQDIEKLKKTVAEVSSVPSVIESFVKLGDNVVKSRQSLNFRGLSSSSHTGQGAQELYFPMAYNDEQVSIIEKLETGDGVVVQGPPGTGKTHTIANVICHFLAQGKRVLVTANGESALAVLQEKLPEQIRPLSVALLTDERDGKKQFENSIQAIANSVNSLNPVQSEKQIVYFEDQINGVHAKISSVEQTINSYAEKHMKRYKFHDKEVSAEEMAKFVFENADTYSWLEDEISSNSEALTFSDNDIQSLRKSRIEVGGDLSSLEDKFPVSDSFPDWSTLYGLHHDLMSASEFAHKISEGNIIPLIDSSQDTFKEAQQLFEFLSDREVLANKVHQDDFEWSKRIKYRFLKPDHEEDSSVTHLEVVSSEIRALDGKRKENLSHAVQVVPNAELNEDFIHAIQRLSKGKNPFAVPWGKKEVKNLLAQVSVMGLKPSAPSDWQAVVRHTEYLLSARKLIAIWNNAVAREFGLDAAHDDIDESFRLLVTYQNHINDIKKLVTEFDSVLGDKVKRVFGAKVTQGLSEADSQFLESLKSSLAQNLDTGRFMYARQQVSALLDKLNGFSGPLVDSIAQFLNEQIGNSAFDESALREQWYALMSELNRMNALQPSFREINRVADLIIQSRAVKWGCAVKSVPVLEAQEGDPLTPSDWLEAWTWRAAKTLIEHIDGHDHLKRLFDDRRALEKELSKTYQDLIAEKTWLGIYNNSPEEIRQALQAYLNAIQSMGAGTGIRAVRFRKDARNAMLRAYKAVPCWILPQWRVSETIPAEVGLFDLVIIDEASQSDIWALPALLRGKKLLVVGDHKQVSPSAIGMKEVKIQELSDRFLNNQPHGAQMTPGKSIYDLARVVFAGNSVMLQEHFRCVNAIIEFSNREFYDNKIKPLRIPKSTERLDPPLIDVKVQGGYRKNDHNPPEAKAIIEEIKTIIADPALEDRTIGVVVLLGNEQANHIWRLINTEIPQSEIVARKIAVGAPPIFQGRERDIMLISNVLAKGNRATANSMGMEQRFNVALSRARDRMYLFRSIEESDVNPGSLTAKVFRHFKQPFTQDVKQVSSLRELCESDFEREMFDLLVRHDFRVTPQVRCGSYRIDFVIEGSEGRRLAVECDGDRFHGPGQWMNDMIRQRVLERAGWTFWRCFASSFFMRKQEVFDDLLATLRKMGIEPLGSESVDNTQWVSYKEVDPYNTVSESSDTSSPPSEEHSDFNDLTHLLGHNQQSSLDSIEEDVIDTQGHRLEMIDSPEIQQVILKVLSECPNQSCTVDSLATRVLKELGIITRGNPRLEFEKKVNKCLGILQRKDKIMKYKAKNWRVKLQVSMTMDVFN
ncbi:AAA domain-containing protein [Methylobacter sp. BBA5.1]|uniref:AAA domain-containing protein n=1 Tax=Methylobacter sp. BBA5.1 TaxID=1495064 RepID=UPI00068CF465|nr:AAA domain-containing protein [Methylobacter sp. BBA5.1]